MLAESRFNGPEALEVILIVGKRTNCEKTAEAKTAMFTQKPIARLRPVHQQVELISESVNRIVRIS